MEEIRKLAGKSGMKTLREAGTARVLNGETTVEELIRATAGRL